MWKYLNRGISTPIAITIILILVIAIGGFTWWQYGEIDNFNNIPLLNLNKSTCSQDAALNYMGEGEDPCDRSCQVDDDCEFECGCDCISKNEQCKYTGVECEAPDPDYGCKCIDGTCIYQYIKENGVSDEKLDLPLVLEKVSFYTYPSGKIFLGEEIKNTGETLIKRDLDGDGREEKIYVDKVKFSEGIGFVLHIGEKSQKLEFWPTDFSVIDIDENDKYQEVVLHNPGPSNDDVSLFFWYNGKEIKKMGKLSRWPELLGNGKVIVNDWMGFWLKTDNYILDKETHLLKWIPKEIYEVGIETKASETIRLYKEKSYDSEIVKEVKPEEEVKIIIAEGCDTYFCEWFQLEAGGIKGWAKQDDFEFKLELSHAD